MNFSFNQFSGKTWQKNISGNWGIWCYKAFDAQAMRERERVFDVYAEAKSNALLDQLNIDLSNILHQGYASIKGPLGI